MMQGWNFASALMEVGRWICSNRHDANLSYSTVLMPEASTATSMNSI